LGNKNARGIEELGRAVAIEHNPGVRRRAEWTSLRQLALKTTTSTSDKDPENGDRRLRTALFDLLAEW
jgi:hypothetical protein